MSGRLTPAASTLMSTSFSRAVGVGISRIARTSGPPGTVTATNRMFAGTAVAIKVSMKKNRRLALQFALALMPCRAKEPLFAPDALISYRIGSGDFASGVSVMAKWMGFIASALLAAAAVAAPQPYDEHADAHAA